MSSATKHDYQFKFIIGGDGGVGKTKLLMRYLEDTYEEEGCSTVGVDFHKKDMEIGDDTIAIRLYDLPGQQQYSAITDQYFRNSIAVILVFSLSDETSFSSIDKWYRKATNLIPPNSAVFILIGNKDDLKPYTVSEDRAREYAESKGMHYFSASAKTGNRVNDFFDETIYDVYNKVKNGELKIETEGTTSLENAEAKKKSWC